MDAFTQAVAETLAFVLYDSRDGIAGLSRARATADKIAPRVAAAIEAVAKPWAADIEHEYGAGRVPDGDRYGDTIGRAQEAALAALRGEG